jgi:hypothetical protein
MIETPSTSTSSASTTPTPHARRNLRAVWHAVVWIVGLGWLGLCQVARSLTAAAFLYRVLCFVMAPFAAWAISLLWFNARHPERIANAVTAGPAFLVQLWIGVLLAAVLGASVLGRHTQARAFLLAIAALMLSSAWLPPLPATTTDARSDVPHP